MGGLWLGGNLIRQQAGSSHSAEVASTQLAKLQEEMMELNNQVGRLSLLNQALWELLRDRLKMTDADLERLAHDVDMRDGVADGKMTATPVRCPGCQRVCNSKHAKCMYCGQLFEKPLFG
jgi:hypothetical protein